MKTAHYFSTQTRCISLVITILLIFYLLPLNIFAMSIEDGNVSNVSAGDNSEVVEYPKGELYEVEDLRDANTKHFHKEDGTYVAASYPSQVHVMDENGNWQDIDNALSEKNGTYVNENARISFSKKITGNGNLFTLKDGNTKLSMNLIGANKGVVGTVTNYNDDAEPTELQKLMNLERLSSRVLYEDILDGVDIEYVVRSLNVKENIKVKEMAESYSYSFELKLNNLDAEISESGDVVLFDKNGNEKYVIPAPVVYDSGYNVAPNGTAYYSIEEKNNKYTLSVTVDSSWMNDENRFFPVTIDPTVEMASDPITVAESEEGNIINQSLMTLTRGNPVYYTVSSLPNLAPNAVTLGISFIVPYAGAAGHYVPALSLYNESGNILIDVAQPSFRYRWDVTDYRNSLVKRTFKIDYYGDITGVETLQFPVFLDPYRAIISEDLYPQYEVRYTLQRGIEDYYSYSEQNVGIAGSGAVNYANGNLTFVVPTLSTTDYLMPTNLSLVYNSSLSGLSFRYNRPEGLQTAYGTSYTPTGFKLNIQETIVRDVYIKSNGELEPTYVLCDADGTEHIFQSAGINKFVDMDGLGLSLDVSSDTLTLTDKDKTVKTYSKMSTSPIGTAGAWYLSKITDKVGNSVIITANSSTYVPEKISLQPNGLENPIDMLTVIYNNGKISMIRNDSTNEAVIFRYSSTPTGNILLSGSSYLRGIIYAHADSSVTDDVWTNYYTNGVSGNITVDATATYTYDESGYLINVKDDLSDKSIQYIYTSGKVTKITEYAGALSGQSIGFTYNNGYTDARNSGSDDIYYNDDDIITRYVFDEFGRVVSSYSSNLDGTEIYGAVSGEYETQDNVKNNIKQTTTVGGETSNYLLNGGFELVDENESALYWGATSGVSFGETDEINNHRGARIRLEGFDSESLWQSLTLDAGVYTVSLRYSSENVTYYRAHLTVAVPEGEVFVYEELPAEKSDPNADYSTHSANFTLTQKTTILVSIDATSDIFGIQKDLYFDNIVLSKGTDVIENSHVMMGHFESTNTDGLGNIGVVPSDLWTTDNEEELTVVDNDVKGIVAKINSGTIKQTIYTASSSVLDKFGEAGFVSNSNVAYTISGFGCASHLVGSDKFRIYANVYYYQGADEEDICITHSFDFAKMSGGWQFVSGSFDCYIEDGDADYSCVRAIEIVCEYTGLTENSYALFDGISVVDTGRNLVRYAYNPEGDLIAYQSLYYTEFYEYDSDRNVIRVANDNGEIHDFVYNDFGVVVEDIYKKFTLIENGYTYYPYGEEDIESLIETDEVSRTEYSYNAYGQITSTTISDGTNSLESETEYDTGVDSKIFGAPIELVDASGNVTQNLYNEKGLLIASTYGDSGIAYSYDSLGRLVGTYGCDITEENTIDGLGDLSNNFTYDAHGYLESIRTDSTLYTFTYDAFGKTDTVEIGDTEIVSYEYNSYNGKIKKINYGNGYSVEYVYNSLEMLSEIWYNYGNGARELAVEYVYTDDGQLFRTEDKINGRVTCYIYDAADRLKETIEYDTDDIDIDFANKRFYSETDGKLVLYLNNLTYRVGNNYYNDSNIRNTYEYNSDGTIAGGNIWDYRIRLYFDYTYDAFKRLSGVTYSTGNAFTMAQNYVYNSNNAQATAQLRTFSSSVSGTQNTAGTSTSYTFTYDARGNITKIVHSDGSEIRYVYDDYGQLIREDNQKLHFTYLYYYDNAGNIISRRTYNCTAAGVSPTLFVCADYYEYTNSDWGDQLSSYKDVEYTYDAIGNPLTYFNGMNYTFTWEGRRLVGATQVGSNTNNTYSFTYNADGIRTSKTVNGVEHKFYLDGTRIIAEEWGDNLLIFFYDASGAPIGMKHRLRSYSLSQFDIYWFESNVHGDIVSVYNEFGKKLVNYVYDAWGYHETVYSNGGESTAAVYNPFRYRGYYHDNEMGMYYLNSRYYDPYTARFVNADSYVSTGTGLLSYNMYAYCNNNPVMYKDPDGTFIVFILVPVVVLLANHIANAIISSSVDKNLNDQYTKEEAKAEIEKITGEGSVAFDQGENLHIKNSVDIKSRIDRIKVSKIVTRTIDENGNNITERTVYGLSAEWVGHNIINSLRDKEDTRNVDLDYNFAENAPLTKFGTVALMIFGIL